MGTESDAGSAVIDEALRGMRETLQADGYELRWAIEKPDQIGLTVVAGADACADCLVPPEIMRAIASGALSGTRYTVGSISLPADA